MAEQFAQEFFWSKGYEVLFAVHTDTDHIHAHFLVSNCNQKDGTSFRRGPKELVEMSKYLGNQCMERGLSHSVRDSFVFIGINNNFLFSKFQGFYCCF